MSKIKAITAGLLVGLGLVLVGASAWLVWGNVRF